MLPGGRDDVTALTQNLDGLTRSVRPSLGKCSPLPAGCWSIFFFAHKSSHEWFLEAWHHGVLGYEVAEGSFANKLLVLPG